MLSSWVRRISGALTCVAAALASAALGLPASAQLASSILPNARAMQITTGQTNTLTVFATVLNTGSATLANCRVEADPTTTGVAVRYFRTDPATNAVVGGANTPFGLAPGAGQTLALAFDAAAPFAGLYRPRFTCDGAAPAPTFDDVNAVTLNFSNRPVVDVIPIALALPNLDGVVRIADHGGLQALVAAAVNLGAADDVSVVPTGGARLRAGLLVCETDAQGACLEPPAAGVRVRFEAGQTRFFTVLVRAPFGEAVPFDPAGVRARLEFRTRWDASVLSGVSSAAVTAPGPAADRVALEEASGFLQQASFGPTLGEIERVAQTGVDAWITAQLTAPRRDRHWDYVIRGGPPGCSPCESQYINAFMESWWLHAIEGEDQLRQRMAWALAQIMVTSSVNSAIDADPLAHAAWYDMLADNALGNYRTLIEAVARHPAMAHYLSHMRNEKEDAATGRIPDENFAREAMQLFSIGLWELNPDGSRRLDSAGNPIPTYGQDEVQGFARVFTGLSWGGGPPTDGRWHGWIFYPEPQPWNAPLQIYEARHSTSAKTLVSGVTIPAGTPGDESLRIALDTLADHPNVGPFLSEQLIKRLVKSNPSRAYVARVAAVFANNGAGERGDLAAVARAILTDPEARDPGRVADPRSGKLREPVLRFSAWLRGFGARRSDHVYRIWNLEDPVGALGQNPQRAPSVFNWYRPDFAPANLAAEGLVGPEFQIAHETTVASYVNFMSHVVSRGYGWGESAVMPSYERELGLVGNPGALVDHLDLLLMSGQMSEETRTDLEDAIATVERHEWQGDGRRLAIGVTMAVASPDFQIQK